MVYENIKLNRLFEGLNTTNTDPTLQAYIIENSDEARTGYKRPSVIICPGGGYRYTSDREAEPVALRFMAAGFNAFVLRYSVAPHRYPTQLLELSAAVAYIRRKADEWHLDTQRIAVCGFSAGGHLAGSLGVFWEKEFIHTTLGLSKGENKPNAMILSYPVITGGEFAHRGSFDNLLGKEASMDQMTALSLENAVTTSTPSTFIWHTLDDSSVPVENSLLFVKALKDKAIPLEVHLYHKGVHGLSLCDQTTAKEDAPHHINPHAATWFPLAVEWLKEIWHMA